MKVYTAGSDSSLKTLAARIFVAILFSSFAGAAWGQGAIKTKFEAWEFRCETPAGETSEQCALTQTVNAEDAANVKLGVMIIKPKQTKNGVFRVIAPLSVFLRNGVGLKIDQTDIGRAGFFRCFTSGCLAEVI